MPTYSGPSGYSAKTAQMDKARRKLNEQVEGGRKAQEINKVFGQFTEKQRAEVRALDHLLNIKEEESEGLSQQIMDQYPKGAFGGGYESRNMNEYGQPVQTPAVEMQGRVAEIPLVPNPLYRKGGLLPEMIPADLARRLMAGK